MIRERSRARVTATHPAFDALEGRPLSASLVVINAMDAGPGSLRQAILDADASHAPSDIAFDIPGDGVHTIAVASSLPPVTAPLAIDGTTQPGYAGSPVVAIDGGLLSIGNVDGLDFASGSYQSVVGGLAIERFSGYGIKVSDNSVTIRSNVIGIDPATGSAAGCGYGIRVSFCANATIGGPTAADGNVIAASIYNPPPPGFIPYNVGGDGITLISALNATIAHNFIGTARSGRTDVGNGANGVVLHTSTGASLTSNIIVNNGLQGIAADATPFTSVDNTVDRNEQRVANVDLAVSSTLVGTSTGRVERLTYTLTNRGPRAATNVRLGLGVVAYTPDYFYNPRGVTPILRPAGAVPSQGAIATDAGFPVIPTINPYIIATLNSINNLIYMEYLAGPPTFASLGTIEPGASASVVVSASIVGSGFETLQARAASDQQSEGVRLVETTFAATGHADLAVAADPAPVAKVGAPETFTFHVANRDAYLSNPITYLIGIDPASGASFQSASVDSDLNAHPAPGPAGFYTTGGASAPSSGATLAAGATSTLTVVVVPTRPGPIRVSLVASSPANVDPLPANNLAYAATTAAQFPTVNAAGLSPSGGKVDAVSIGFDAPMKTSQAQDVRNYHLSSADQKSGIKIRSATYNAKTHDVTLRLAKALPRPGTPVSLTVGGPGTPGLAALDGSKLTGSGYRTTLNRG